MSPTYRGGPNINSLFYEKIRLINKNLINLMFMILSVSMELHCNGKNLKSQINLIFLDQTDFFLTKQTD